MKARIIICLVILFALANQNSNLKAQWVTIPDANFVTLLQAAFPTCMNGNQMDTTCLNITSTTYFAPYNNSISDLTGIQYFDNLHYLECSSNQLTSLPPLPQNLTELFCEYNQLVSLPSLPQTLTRLNCNNNPLTSLPALPNSLLYLYCYFDDLTSLPSLPPGLLVLKCDGNELTSLPSLPSTLVNFDCRRNHLTSLPSLPNLIVSLPCSENQLTSLPPLPASLESIDCSQNLLTSLPNLPNTLTYLNCFRNQLTSLPPLINETNVQCGYNQITNIPFLPDSLIFFYCNNNQITSLPSLPAKLQSLYCTSNLLTSLPLLLNTIESINCDSNQIASLPPLPNNLSALVCNQNQLTSLPTLPNSLWWLQCYNNNISCFPTLPNNLNYPGSINISNNPFTCLPNYVPAMDSITLTYPLCVVGDTTNNANNCQGAQGIAGSTFSDADTNCTYNNGDIGFSNIPIKLYDNANNLISQTSTFCNGHYDFPAPTGTYIIKLDTANIPLMSSCPFPGNDSLVVLSSGNILANNINFNIVCKQGFDVGVQSVTTQGIVFPGQQHSLKFVEGDLSNWYNLNCASGVSGQVIVTITGPVTYNNIISGALTPTIIGNVFTYSIADFGTINSSTAFGLNFITDSTAQSGDMICVNVSVTPTIGDNNTSNNSYNYCYTVSNSYDPNYKETYPETVQPGFNDYFTYTIHFQNTGNAPAINIHLQDTLDTNLDLNTFQVINYSHYNTTWLNGNKLSVNFPNIQLPDSTADFDGSQGFIQYRIKPLPGLPAGTQIHNKASIYFDFNSPIVTNTTLNEFLLPTGIQENTNATFSVYPNPSTGKFTIDIQGLRNQSMKVEVLNILGESVQKKLTMDNGQLTMDLSEQPNGIYTVRIIGGNQSLNQRVVKQ